jgi:hypothetical protein
MQLELTSAELEVLRDLINRELGNLKEEVYKTDTPDYKTLLRQREATIVSIQDKLQAV